MLGLLLLAPVGSHAQTVGTDADTANPLQEGVRAPTSPLSRPEANDRHDDQPSGADAAKAAAAAPPPSLPGSHAQPIPAAPASRASGDMNPTDALFDAINRGDIAAVRDALNRGAEIEAHNVLGQTPLALSVDLGRNDISFLLLSMRAPPDAAPGPGAGGSRPIPVSARAGRAQGQIPGQIQGQIQGQIPGQIPAQTSGQAPVPSAGFLGFGGGS